MFPFIMKSGFRIRNVFIRIRGSVPMDFLTKVSYQTRNTRPYFLKFWWLFEKQFVLLTTGIRYWVGSSIFYSRVHIRTKMFSINEQWKYPIHRINCSPMGQCGISNTRDAIEIYDICIIRAVARSKFYFIFVPFIQPNPFSTMLGLWDIYPLFSTFMNKSFSFDVADSILYWGRILGRDWDKSLEEFSFLLFTVTSTNGFYSHPPPPPPLEQKWFETSL
jgi:hypothetical protein